MTELVPTRPAPAVAAMAATCLVPSGAQRPLAVSRAPFSGGAARDIWLPAAFTVCARVVPMLTRAVPR